MITISDPQAWLPLYTLPLSARTSPPDHALDTALQAAEQALAGTPASNARWQQALAAALAPLPETLQQLLNQYVLGIFAAQGLPVTGRAELLTDQESGQPLGFALFLAHDILDAASANKWASRATQAQFNDDAHWQVSVKIAESPDDDPVHALRLQLLHAAGGLLAAMTDLCPATWTLPLPKLSGSFASQSWTTEQQPQPEEDFPQRHLMTASAQTTLPAASMPDVFRDLARTRFPTLYAARDPQADFAACFATYVHTQLLDLPYQVQLHAGTSLVFESDDFWQSARASGKRHYLQRLMTLLTQTDASRTFQGLAPFLRMSLSGADLRAHTQSLLMKAQADQDNAVLWMNLATGFLCLKMRDMGLAIQEQALSLQRLYTRPANVAPPQFRLLMIMTAGDLSENTPIDCLLEDSPVELLYYYASVDQPLPHPLPPHDAVMVALSDSAENRALLLAIQARLQQHTRPVINPPQLLPLVNRDQLSQLLQGVTGLEMPQTLRLPRSQVVAGAALPDFPLIIRPVGSQAGNDLARITQAAALTDYLESVDSPEFFVSRFVDYSSADGQFRKYRIAMLRGQPFISHMAISSDWMVHYVNAGMYDSAEKRAEEDQFMQQFAGFAARHQAALAGIYQRLPLDYLCIDCAETRDGKLLVFEIDHIMAVHAMDSTRLFPFKAAQIAKLQHAFEGYLHSLLPQPLMESA